MAIASWGERERVHGVARGPTPLTQALKQGALPSLDLAAEFCGPAEPMETTLACCRRAQQRLRPWAFAMHNPGQPTAASFWTV